MEESCWSNQRQEQHMGEQRIPKNLIPKPRSGSHRHQSHKPRRILRRFQELPESLSLAPNFTAPSQTLGLVLIHALREDQKLGRRSQRSDADARRLLLQPPKRQTHRTPPLRSLRLLRRAFQAQQVLGFQRLRPRLFRLSGSQIRIHFLGIEAANRRDQKGGRSRTVDLRAQEINEDASLS